VPFIRQSRTDGRSSYNASEILAAYSLRIIIAFTKAPFSVTSTFFVRRLPAFDASKLLQQRALSIFVPELLWHVRCALPALAKGDQQ
jgi:hypothetical protein